MLADECDRQICGGPPEHIREHQHFRSFLMARVLGPPDSRDRRTNLLAREIDVLMPPNRHRGEMRQIADDHLCRIDQFSRQLPVRDDDNADIHEYSEALRPSDSPTRALVRRSAGSLRSRGLTRALVRRMACTPLSGIRDPGSGTLFPPEAIQLPTRFGSRTTDPGS